VYNLVHAAQLGSHPVRQRVEATDAELVNRIIRQGRALVKAIEGLSEADPTGPIEWAMELGGTRRQRWSAITREIN
jgi:hypothetical protein